MRPYLKNLLEENYRYLIFLAAEIEFEKIDDPSDTMTIFSSVRNSHWLVIDNLNEDHVTTLVDRLLVNFFKQYFDDIEATTRRKGSGWVYKRVVQINSTHLKRQPLGLVGYARSYRAHREYNQHLKPVLIRNVIDSARYYHPGLECVPGSIILKMEYIRLNGRIYDIAIGTVKSMMSSIRIEGLLGFNKDGIPKENFSKIESLNYGFNGTLLRAYPFLGAFKGLALNLFKITHSSSLNKYWLLPIQLSKHWNSNEFFQIDLLDSKFVFKDKNLSPSPALHVLLIASFHRLAQNCLLKSGVKAKPYTCRACCKSHMDITSHRTHTTHCAGHMKHEKAVLVRKRTNRVLHRPVFQNRYNKTVKIVSLKFQPRNYSRSLKPILFGSLDFEATNQSIPLSELPTGAPRNTVFMQKPFGFSLGFATPYDIPLPPELEKIEVKFYDERINTLDDFYLDFLLTLREYLLHSYNFMRSVLNNDLGPPDLAQVPIADRLAYHLATNCSFCGIPYNTRRKNPVTNKVYVAFKARHHNHLIRIPNLAKKGDIPGQVITLCPSCNVATHSDGFISRSNLTIVVHNGSKYDNHFITDALTRISKRLFEQHDKNGELVQLPILKNNPGVLYKSDNTIMSIKVRFNCPFLALCPYHGAERTSKRRHCPFHRAVLFVDSCLQLGASLDMMIQDVATCQLNKDLPSKEIFPKTYQLISKQFGYEESVFHLVISGKCPQVLTFLAWKTLERNNDTSKKKNHKISLSLSRSLVRSLSFSLSH